MELPEYVRRAIYGEVSLEEKRAALDKSTNNWWREYTARKNDEDEEHVADTLLYDERCHLPRSAPRPDGVVMAVVNDSDSSSTACPATGYPSFIESGFRTRVEYVNTLKLPPADFAAAESAARTAYARPHH